MNSTFKALAATTFLFAMMMYSNLVTSGNDNNGSKSEQVSETVATHVTERSMK